VFSKKDYLLSLEKWNKVHRLYGNSSAADLLDESIASLSDSMGFLEPVLSSGGSFLDVGAGAGFMGAACLCLFPSSRVIFLEPNAKAVGFLLSYFAKLDKTLVVRDKIESVSRETFGQAELFSASRAFYSKNESLLSLWERSALRNDPLYKFCVDKNEDCLKTYSLKRVL